MTLEDVRWFKMPGQHAETLTRFILSIFLLLIGLPDMHSSRAFEPGDLVAPINVLKLRVETRVCDIVAPGETLRVLAVHGTDIWVSRGKPGWASSADVLSLNEAETFFTKSLDKHMNPRELLARGTVRVSLGKADLGISDIRKAAEISNDPKSYSVPLAFAYLTTAQYAEAIKLFDAALSDNLDDALATMGRGVANYHLGKFEAAVTDLGKAQKMEPLHALPLKYLGAIHYDSSALSEARQELDAAVQLDAYDPFTRNVRGRLLFDKMQYEAALEDFRVVLSIDPKDATGLTGRGLCLLALGKDLQQAERDFQRASEGAVKSKENAYLWSNLGQAQLELGHFGQAIESLTQAIALDPAFNEARSHRAYASTCLASKGEQNLEIAKSDVRTVFVSGVQLTYWDFRAAGAVNAALGDYARAASYQANAIEALKANGPPRYIDEATKTHARYRDHAPASSR